MGGGEGKRGGGGEGGEGTNSPTGPPHGFFSSVFRGYLKHTSELGFECMDENVRRSEADNVRPVIFRRRPYFGRDF